jgi:hypothetical protein
MFQIRKDFAKLSQAPAGWLSIILTSIWSRISGFSNALLETRQDHNLFFFLLLPK